MPSVVIFYAQVIIVRDCESKRGWLIIHHGKGDEKPVVFNGTASKQASVTKYMASRSGAKQNDPAFRSATAPG